jgi:cation diffusion facilitator CzcD-associated flavoprotein CzcO
MRISEPAREIDVVHRTGVLVVGSGPGGLAAAVDVELVQRELDRQGVRYR